MLNKAIFIVSFLGNRGTFSRGVWHMVTDFEFLYHIVYFLFTIAGLMIPLCYSVLVSDFYLTEFRIIMICFLFRRPSPHVTERMFVVMTICDKDKLLRFSH